MPWSPSPLGVGEPSPQQVSLVELLVVIAIIGVLVAVPIFTAVQAAREAGSADELPEQSEELRAGGAELRERQEEVAGGDGKKRLRRWPQRRRSSFEPYQSEQFSWIVHVLPYMELQSLYSQVRMRRHDLDLQ